MKAHIFLITSTKLHAKQMLYFEDEQKTSELLQSCVYKLIVHCTYEWERVLRLTYVILLRL